MSLISRRIGKSNGTNEESDPFLQPVIIQNILLSILKNKCSNRVLSQNPFLYSLLAVSGTLFTTSY